MKDESLSRAIRIDDPAAGAIFASSKLRRILMVFAAGPLSLTEAASRSNIDLKRLHHQAQKLVRLGLLEVRAIRRRAGRPIKLYQATSDTYFIPDEVLPKPFSEELSNELRERLSSRAAKSSRGLLLTVGSNGEPRGRVISNDRAQMDGFEFWRILRLSRADRQKLGAEIEAVLQRFQKLSAAQGGVYLVHAALVRRKDESGAVDNG